jgi:anaerobic selenocysteine-containing dehydrogenase
VIDTLSSPLTDAADIVLPGATWVEKAGTFENARGMLQAFPQAIPVIEMAKPEGQIGLDLLAVIQGREAPPLPPMTVLAPSPPGRVPDAVEVAAPRGEPFIAEAIRARMAELSARLSMFASLALPSIAETREADMAMVDL